MADCDTSSRDSACDKLCVETTCSPVEYQNDHTLSQTSDAASPSSIFNKYTNMDVRADSYLTSMFGPVLERCVTFCIDTSGSMFSALNVVKDQLMETLYSLAARKDKPMFNLIEFNSHVTQWADKLVDCTPETVNVAKEWLSNLKARTGTNTQDALLTALTDPDCQAVYLITDDTPDQQTEKVLDKVIGICGRRHIHCIYISGETIDEAATEFLEDLAVETFGSFNIVQLSSHGSIKKIIPVYRSEPSHEKLVWTVNDTLRPNIKTCSVSTTLQLDPDEILHCYPYARPVLFSSNHSILRSSVLNTLPDYYYPHNWSWYHPSKVWLKAHNKLNDPLFGVSPVAGSLLLGKKVIARRLEDGYFYRATVQSQNPGKSFLVAFGPSKHGKYQQTEYQDVFIFDIMDYSDALHHAIIKGDRVLAPWEPEGDRFAPGVVIDGQEKRQVNGPNDYELTVSFSNGQTEKVPYDVAVWIPPSMYERLSLELKMSASARKILYSTVENYPIESLPGYPTADCSTGYLGTDHLVLESPSYLWNPALSWYPPYLSLLYGYPPYLIKQRVGIRRGKSPPPAVACDDDSTLIPNTGMTKQELEERVMMQLMEHRCSSGKGADVWSGDKMPSIRKESTFSTSSRLLGRREKQEEHNLNRHVHFETGEKTKESSVQDNEYYDDSDYDAYGNFIEKNDSAVNTDSSLLFYSSPGIRRRPGWRKFWRSEPSPPYNAISDGLGCAKSSSTSKPFRETALQAPLEARDQRNPPYNVEWASSAFKYVDTFAKHDYSNSVKECLSMPKPANSCTQRHSVEPQPIADLTAEEREELRRENRRRRVLKREADWQEKLVEENNMKAIMQDNHRERILSQLERDRQRQIKEMLDIQQVREAKKKISAELRARIESNQKEEAEKEEKRIVALSKKRERREHIEAQHNKEIQECIQRHQQIRKQNNEARMKASTEQLNEEEIQAGKLDKQHRNAKLHRLHHFQKLEKENQKKKDLRVAVTEQNLAISRSQIFS